MGRIFCIIGKSGSGKDTVLSGILNKNVLGLENVVTYTTRPRRINETEGKEYFFTDNDTLFKLEKEGKIIEKRCYHTVHGDWNYFTCDIDISGEVDHIMIGTPDVVDKLYERYDRDSVYVIMLELDNRERLLRCINRESGQKSPNYSEVCRRYLADESDFDEERMNKYKNLYRVDSLHSQDENVDECLKIINSIIEK